MTPKERQLSPFTTAAAQHKEICESQNSTAATHGSQMQQKSQTGHRFNRSATPQSAWKVAAAAQFFRVQATTGRNANGS
jgi:hypothetical protein